jgi:hypothetical protein
MNVPNSHHLRAKLSPDAQRLDEAGRLRNLQFALRLANKTVRDYMRLSYARNKRYYDQSAKARTLKEGDTVYVHNRLGRLESHEISRQFGRDHVVLGNRLDT